MLIPRCSELVVGHLLLLRSVGLCAERQQVDRQGRGLVSRPSVICRPHKHPPQPTRSPVCARRLARPRPRSPGVETPPRGCRSRAPEEGRHTAILRPMRRWSARRSRATIRATSPTKIGDAARAIELGASLTAFEVAGPGFLNLRLSDDWYAGGARPRARRRGFRRRRRRRAPERINVEFPSANPTGPMHIGHGRNAAYGDALCRVLDLRRPHGHPRVLLQRLRHPGRALRRSRSRRARAATRFPRTATRASTSTRSPASIDGAAEMAADELQHVAVAQMLERIGETLHRMGVSIDVWFSERSLHAGRPLRARDRDAARAAGHVYEHDGALWLRTTDFGDDKDRVLRRSERRLHLLRDRHRLPRRTSAPAASTA